MAPPWRGAEICNYRVYFPLGCHWLHDSLLQLPTQLSCHHYHAGRVAIGVSDDSLYPGTIPEAFMQLGRAILSR